MSHISIFKEKVNDIAALREVCKRRGVQFEQMEDEAVTGEFFRGQKFSGIAKINLSLWRYPLVIDEKGQIHYDNFGSQQGSMEQLGSLLQDYNMEVVKKNMDATVWDNIVMTENEYGEPQMELINY